MDGKDTFGINDTTFSVWCVGSDSFAKAKRAFRLCEHVCRTSGFLWGPDPRIERDYPSLSASHRYGRLGDLEVKAETGGRVTHFNFYQNIVTENPHGGEYDFQQLSKMPYLVRLKFQGVSSRMESILTHKGFTPKDDPKFDSKYDEIKHKQSSSWHSDSMLNPKPGCNTTDADGNQLNNGYIRYFYDTKDGHLKRGQVFSDLNNMWWVVMNRHEATKVANFRLFSRKPGLKRRYREGGPKRLRKELDKAVGDLDFERAIVLRDLIEAA